MATEEKQILEHSLILHKCHYFRMKLDETNNYEQYRPFPLYVMLCCGVIVILIGVYLLFSNNSAQGVTIQGKLGTGGGRPISVSGSGTILIGVLISLFPAFQLIKRKKKT
jgi:hypothetical protein